MGKCCVCGQETSCTRVKSTCSSNILNYCTICLQNGYESYEELVNYGVPFDCFSHSLRDRVIRPTLRYLNKTVEQFNNDVELKRKEME